MVVFIIFSLSCATTKNIRLDADSAEKVKKGEILSVVMTSGETIEFSKEQPGRIYNGSITGRAVRVTKEKESILGRAVRVTGELDKAYIKEIEKDANGKIIRMIVSIPLSDTEVIMIVDNKFNLAKSILVVLGIAPVAIGVLLLILTGGGGYL
jgi:hypothetical protein